MKNSLLTRVFQSKTLQARQVSLSARHRDFLLICLTLAIHRWGESWKWLSNPLLHVHGRPCFEYVSYNKLKLHSKTSWPKNQVQNKLAQEPGAVLSGLIEVMQTKLVDFNNYVNSGNQRQFSSTYGRGVSRGYTSSFRMIL